MNQAVFGEVASVATSLVLETGNTFSLAQVLRELDAQLRRQLELLQLDVGLIQMRHRELSATLGHSVRIHGVAGEAWGDAIGFTDQGALQIQTRSGKIEVYDGSVSCDILY